MHLFQNIMILQRELYLCNFHIFISFYTIPGARHLPALSVPTSGEFASFI